MSESVKTLAFIALAAALTVTAVVVEPETATPRIRSDEGEAFYPNFRDPQAVKTIEVVDYDEASATIRPFQVDSQKGRWVLPTHSNYPVDAGERLVKTAAALIDLKKDSVRSDSTQDHAKFGVIDPGDTKSAAAGLAGRGKRVTLRDARKDVLADFIFGKAVEGKEGYRYVRIPGQKRVYAVKTDADPSTRFQDWVNSGIASIPTAQIRRVLINNYSIDESMGALTNQEVIPITREGDQWKIQGLDKFNNAAVQGMAAALANLKIVDVKPKPPQLAADLRSGQLQMSLETALSLRQKGFFISPNGRLLANEGEMTIETANGLVLTLRFGEVVSTPGESKPSGNRYLFPTAVFDEKRAARYAGDAVTGERQAKDLANRFADWYYVIGADEFKRLRLKRGDLLR
jgi:hypothetical protein